jgi:uncharacterized protein YeeX (DUF496 family)
MIDSLTLDARTRVAMGYNFKNAKLGRDRDNIPRGYLMKSLFRIWGAVFAQSNLHEMHEQFFDRVIMEGTKSLELSALTDYIKDGDTTRTIRSVVANIFTKRNEGHVAVHRDDFAKFQLSFEGGKQLQVNVPKHAEVSVVVCLLFVC